MQHQIFSSGESLACIINFPEASEPRPCVIFSNGFAAYKEMYDGMAAAFNAAGYVTLQYDPRGSKKKDKGRFLCGTQWLEDLNNCISYMSSLDEVDASRIALTGVSMGGGLTLLQAAVDWRIKCAVAMAPCPGAAEQYKTGWVKSRGETAWEGFRQEVLEDAQKVAHGEPSCFVPIGYLTGKEAANPVAMVGGEACPPENEHPTSMEAILNCMLYFNPMAVVGNIHIPVCYIHGDADTTISVNTTRALYDKTVSIKALNVIPGGAHVLPDEEWLPQVNAICLEWFKAYLD